MASQSDMMRREGIDAKIHFVRGQRVMLDSDLAATYGVTTAALNQALKRNLQKFPSDFAYQLTYQEFTNLISQIVTSSCEQKPHGGRRKLPWAFTEHGAIMLATVLKSARAIEMSVFVVRAFVRMREMLMGNRELAAKLDELENRVTGHDEVIGDLVSTIREMLNPSADPKPEIGFHVREEAPPYTLSPRF